MPKRVRPEVEIKLSELAAQHRDWSPRLLADAINREFQGSDQNAAPAVSERWIRDRLPQLRDRSEYWRLQPGERDFAFVFEVLGAIGSDGTYPRLTVDEVGWLRVVHEAGPHLTAREALRTARLYMTTDKIENGRWVAHSLDWILASGGVPSADPSEWLKEPPDFVAYIGPKED